MTLARRKRPVVSEEEERKAAFAKLAAEVKRMTKQLQRLLSPTPPQGGFQLRGLEFSCATSTARELAKLHYMWQRNYSNVYSEILDAYPDLAELQVVAIRRVRARRGGGTGSISGRAAS
eukprot:2306971-Pleurochrysis_carterae.AAC.1